MSQYLFNIKITLWPNFMSISFLDLALQPILCTRHLISNPQVHKLKKPTYEFWYTSIDWRKKIVPNSMMGGGRAKS